MHRKEENLFLLQNLLDMRVELSVCLPKCGNQNPGKLSIQELPCLEYTILSVAL